MHWDKKNTFYTHNPITTKQQSVDGRKEARMDGWMDG